MARDKYKNNRHRGSGRNRIPGFQTQEERPDRERQNFRPDTNQIEDEREELSEARRQATKGEK